MGKHHKHHNAHQEPQDPDIGPGALASTPAGAAERTGFAVWVPAPPGVGVLSCC